MAITGQSGTLLGPLTTAWSMPETCTIHLDGSRNRGFRGQRCAVSSGTARPEDNVNCWPPATNLPEIPAPPFIGWGFYSPGLACPTGYTAACTAQYGGRAGWETQFTLIPGETAIGCCPDVLKGYKCTNINGNTCIAAKTQLTIATASCSGSQVVGLGQATIPVIIEITTTETATATSGQGAIAVQTTTEEVLMLAPMFQLNYQASDLETGTTSPPSATSTDSSAATDQGGLSTGAIVGIGVGAALGALLLGAVAILLFMRNRKRQRELAPESNAIELHSWSGPHAVEMPAGHESGRLSHHGHS
ncbi:hypothetical protein C8A01DRAFT_14965 [Parachaetomium inaequale]|uniref:Uncharacterized protein n=1 Tax=Parachaetomium inaequale TaxID=2588326 RepID=A0AAN6PJL7_9PEZI|nr:hypothetical protein C8A01DRAFT_14965 [Parachaetomium inaequale]